MRRLRFLSICLLLLVVASLLGYLYLDREMGALHTPTSSMPFEIPPGLGAREILRLLHDRGAIGNENLAMAYLLISGQRKDLKAGEYLFDRPVTTHEVVETLVKGSVYLHKFTVPEGLTLPKVALQWEQQGFGDASSFVEAAKDSLDLLKEFEGDQPASASLEGYLFPETYFFPIRTKPRQALEAMVGRFRSVLAQLSSKAPAESWPLNIHDTVILASLVEAEAAVDDERPLIASVFLNRLKLRMLMQCDPTVIYALEMENRYQGQLTRADLKFDSPYNTYRYAGLPPGPISNPGKRSLEAAIRPAVGSDLYFVRTTEGRHTFSENLSNHNKAVTAYRAQKAPKAPTSSKKVPKARR